MATYSTVDLNESLPDDLDVYDDYSYYYNYSLISPVEVEGLQIASTITAVFYGLIAGVSITGNSFLLWVLLQQRGLRSSANLFLLHLIISDVTFTLALVPWAVYHVRGWIFGGLACKLLSGAIYLGFYSYILFVTCMTVHRYMKVVHAVRSASIGDRRAACHTRLTCGLVWLVSVGCSLPETFFSTIENEGNVTTCVHQKSLEMELVSDYIQISIFFLLPLFLIVFCYTRIADTIHRCQIGSKRRSVWLIFSIVVGFFICWTPYNITIFINSLHLLEVKSLHNYEWKKSLAYAYYITHIMAYSHCCINPIIQIFGGRHFRGRLPHLRFSRLSERDTSHTLVSQNAQTHM